MTRPDLAWLADGLYLSGAGPWGASLSQSFPISLRPGYPVPAALRVLDRLLMDEEGAVVEEGVLVPYPAVYALESFERVDLGVPAKPTPVDIEIRANGYVRQGGGLSVEAGVRLSDGSTIPQSARIGATLSIGRDTLLLEQAAYELLRRVDEGGGESLESQHRLAADVTRLASAAEATLDSWLENQRYLSPEGIGVGVDVRGPDHIELIGTPEGIEEDFDVFERDRGPTRTTYTKRAGTRRTRLVLSEEQRETADELKSRRDIRGPDVPRFFDNPEAFLPDGIDIERFSPRVRGLKPQRYRSQPYLDIREKRGKRDWFAVSPRIELLADDVADLPPPDPAWGSAADPTDEGSKLDRGAAGRDGSEPGLDPDTYGALCRTVLDNGEPWVLHDGSWVHIEPDRAEKYLAAFEQAEVGDDGAWLLPTSAIGMVLDVISNVEQLEFSVEGASPLLTELPDYPVPSGLAATLYPHQDFGYRWLRFLHEHEYGGLLADDMGLGKTVQVAALLAHLADVGELGPSLLVLPKSLIPNWRRELRRFCPTIRTVLEYQGPARRKSPTFLAQWDVVLTTYGTLRRDQLVLGAVDWEVVACDEAQKVKNPTTQVTSAVKGMKARIRLALTGTPVENGLSELWCIVDFVQPGKLGSRQQFRDRFERPIVESRAADQMRLAHSLQEQLDPHYVRRKKEDILHDLPPKSVEQYRVPLGDRQERLYAGVIGRMKGGDVIPIAALQHLIQVCSHPELLDPTGAPVASLVDECPKLAATVGVLREIETQDERVVIFTRYRAMQAILQRLLSEEFGVLAPIINGESSGVARQRRVDEFNDSRGFGALVLSPEAAGVGLNITGANHVIHYSRLWNPAKEAQATDRVHRLGQNRPVTVHYPIVEGEQQESVEEHLDTLLQEKAELAKNVLWPRESLSVAADLQRIFGAEA